MTLERLKVKLIGFEKPHSYLIFIPFFLGFLYGNFGQIRSVRLCSPTAIDGMQMRGITDVPGAYPIHKKVIIELVKIFFFFKFI